MATSITEKVRITDILLEELEGFEYCREEVTLLSGTAAAVVGQVLGRISVAATATETHAGNTGNGVMTLDVTTPVQAGAVAGVYTVACVTAATNGGTFRVFNPNGSEIGEVAVAATFNNKIKFVIADGATDFIVGDTFLVTVAAGSLKYAQVTPAAVNGSQAASGVLLTATDASAADAIGVALVRGPAIVKVPLVYTSGMSSPQKATALADLKALGIIARTAL